MEKDTQTGTNGCLWAYKSSTALKKEKLFSSLAGLSYLASLCLIHSFYKMGGAYHLCVEQMNDTILNLLKFSWIIFPYCL